MLLDAESAVASSDGETLIESAGSQLFDYFEYLKSLEGESATEARPLRGIGSACSGREDLDTRAGLRE